VCVPEDIKISNLSNFLSICLIIKYKCFSQIRHCLERCQICSDMGISQRWIWINSEICKSWFQVEICGGVTSGQQLLFDSLSPLSLDILFLFYLYVCILTISPFNFAA